MSWRALTTADILPIVSATEIDAYREQLLDDGQADPLGALLAQATLQVREAIRSNPDNVLDADPTYLPEGAVWWASVLVRHRIAGRLEDTIRESWKADYDQAIKWLSDVRAGKVAIESSAAGGESAPGPSNSPQISARTKTFGRTSQNGI